MTVPDLSRRRDENATGAAHAREPLPSASTLALAPDEAQKNLAAPVAFSSRRCVKLPHVA
jgi:hypothetical protein